MSVRRIPRRLLGLLVVSTALLALAAFWILKPNASAPLPSGAARPRLPAPPEALPPPHIETIRPGATLAAILARHGFAPAEVARLRDEAKPLHDLAKLQAGRPLRFYVDVDLRVVGFDYDTDELHCLRVRRAGEGFRAELRAYPYEERKAFAWGTIGDNLITAVEASGEDIPLALALAEIFGWDIDFYTDPRPGDRFCVAFIKRYIDGRFAGYGNVLAARFTCRGRDFCAIRYVYPDTRAADYFDRSGGSLRKEFLRSPFKFTPRVTSRFSASRLHPIRRIPRPHHGVDFAAPIGTEVRATGDGTVLFAGMNGAAGRMVKLRHAGGYVTMYLHLSRLGEGVRPGARVASGQAIGYVGSSGESTGPHLDYRIQYHGAYVNPLGWRFEPAAPLRAEFREDFEKTAAPYDLMFRVPFLYGLRSLAISLF